MNTKHLTRFGTVSASVLVAAAWLAACSKQTDATVRQAESEQPAAKVADSGDVCAAHGAPKQLCFICDASLREKGRLWCNEHARYEDRCWLCHPELEDKDRLFCKEHSLYEDECFLCHPELLKGEGDPPTPKASLDPDSPRAMAGGGLMCKEHNLPEAECGICHPELLKDAAGGIGMKVRLPSMESAAKAGIVTARPELASMSDGIETYAELAFNQNRVAQITPLVSGVVKSVEVDLGDRVSDGDVLARLTSVAIGEAQGAFLRALAEDRLREKTLTRERNLREQRISSEKDLQEAEAAHQSAAAAVQQARQQLIVLGFDEQQIEALAAGVGGQGILDIRAPFAGEIVERSAVQGAMAELGKPLLTIADTSTLWALVSIPESQLAVVKVGQEVELTSESLPGQMFTGSLTWIAAKVDDHTRMARGRVELDNTERQLKAQMFARARILTGRAEQAIVIPQSALQRLDGKPLVFVKLADDLYDARLVELGGKHNGHVAVQSGLLPTDEVVVKRGFTMKTQLLISRLGAGCVDH
jgi:cobalt-zinc-cadmium efflux system membrane fusion protein